MGNQEEISKLIQNFGTGLNQHGYSFQHAVIKLAKELHPTNSLWIFQASEFPVSINGVGTRIDFIMRRKQKYSSLISMVLLAECKRANPSHSNWCFAKAPFISRKTTHPRLYIESFGCSEYAEKGVTTLTAFGFNDPTYQIALEIKSGDKGDAVGQGKGVIEEAATQVLRGLSGMLELYQQKTILLEGAQAHLFLPVIFTTAKIWTTELDISTADIETGNINISNLSLEEKPWIIYQYNLSPGLKHTLPISNTPKYLVDVLEQEYIRSIPIVSARGIEKFLTWSSFCDNFEE